MKRRSPTSTNSDDRLNILGTNHRGCISTLHTDKNVPNAMETVYNQTGRDDHYGTTAPDDEVTLSHNHSLVKPALLYSVIVVTHTSG